MTTPLVDNLKSNYRDIVEQKWQDEIDAYASSRGKTRVHESLSHATDHISVSYKGRTLIELIQNGYDAHPDYQCDGEISILLDTTEETYGCLYVANRGLGFTTDNFNGICNIALSPKPVNQGIGNKGLGFRSVLQICKLPEIYSRSENKKSINNYDGFCFSFPTDSELKEMLSVTSHALYQDEIVSNIPRLLLPVVIDNRPNHVLKYAEDGFATVIRMPLYREDAVSEIRDQIKNISDDELPVQLFLNRIKQIQIQIIENSDEDSDEQACQLLPRQLLDTWREEEISYEKVKIDDDYIYLVAKRQLPEEIFRPLLLDGIQAGELPESWKDWQDAPEISVAVGIDSSGEPGRLYSFLPMTAAAESPCVAHISAPFLCDIDRTKLVNDVRLNEYFLEQAAVLCLLVSENIKVSRSEWPRHIVPDLTMWTGAHTHKMILAAQSLMNCDLETLELIPSSTESKSFPWTNLKDVYIWPKTNEVLEILTSGKVAKIAEVDFVDSEINDERIRRLEDVSRAVMELTLVPIDETLADWVEQVASDLLKNHVAIKKWDRFYTDLICLFSNKADVLRKKRILLTGNDKLAQAMEDYNEEEDAENELDRKKHRSQAVFLPNTRSSKIAESPNEEDDETDIELEYEMPSSLSGSIQLIHNQLACAQRKDESGVRKYLISNRLVNEFQTTNLQRLLAKLTANPRSGKNPNKRRMRALQFSFEISERGKHLAELRAMPFHIPNKAGEWIPARQAYFGSDWPGTRGAELRGLVDAASSTSNEIEEIGNATLAETKTWTTNQNEAKEWSIFLRGLGVNDTLRLKTARPPGALKVQGRILDNELLKRCKLHDSIREYWAKDLHPLADAILNPYTDYTVSGRVPIIPGLNEFDKLSPSARRLFAQEIICVLEKEGESLLTIIIQRPDHGNSNRTEWPSPILSFLRHAEWLPAQSLESHLYFAQPKDVWHFQQRTTTMKPDFLPIIDGECRMVLDLKEEAQKLLHTRCNMRVINSPLSAVDQVCLLGKLAKDKRIRNSHCASFDSLYSVGWQHLARNTNALHKAISRDPFCLAVHSGTEIIGFILDLKPAVGEVKPERPSTPFVYLADGVVLTTRDLLKELEKPVFDFKFDDRASIANTLNMQFANLQLISSVELSVYVDGSLVDATDDDLAFITPERRWLQDAILIICDLSAGFLNLGAAGVDKMRTRIARLKYRLVNHIEIEIDKHRMDLPEFAQGCLPYNHDKSPIILIETDKTELSWGVLQKASHAIAEALQYPTQLSSVLGSAFAQLEGRQGSMVFNCPSKQDYQSICRKGSAAVEESLRSLRQIVERIKESLIPVIRAITVDDTFEKFVEETVEIDSEEKLVTLLHGYQDKISIDVDTILDICRRNDSLNSIRCELGIELAKFNNALRTLGSPYRVLDFSEDQSMEFKSFVNKNRTTIFDSLRGAFLQKFDANEPLDIYIAARELQGLEASSEWAEIYDRVPEDDMTALINVWLASHAASPLHEVISIEDMSFEECRAANREHLRKLIITGWSTLSAWCRINKKEIPTPWRVRSEAPQALGSIAHSKGWLDFRMLDEVASIKRLRMEKVWPDGMPPILARHELGLSLTEIDAAAEEELNLKREKARLANIIEVGDKELSIDQSDLPDVLDELLTLFEENSELWSKHHRVAPLDKTKANTPKGGSGGGSGGGAPRGLPPGQKSAIGLLGEKLAFEWLKRKYPTLVSEECWVSKNRELVLQSGPGDDLLGYDFIIEHTNYVTYYEVKATMGDNPFFRMGPTEVEAAIKYRHDGKNRFRILFIERVTEPDKTRIHLLPNPYSEQYRDRFRLVTKGEIGLKFNLSG